MITTTAFAAKISSLPPDAELVLQTAHVALLAAAARGEVDLNQMAREELASRGLDSAGRWVGFVQANALLAAAPPAGYHVR